MFEVLGEAAVAAEPRQRPFYDPTAGQDFEALGGIGSLDDLDGPFADAAQGFAQLVAGIATIGEQVPEPREPVDDFSEQQRCPVTILDIGRVDQGVDEVALGVGQDMALAALDLLARIIATRAAALGGLDALAVDDAGAGRGFTVMDFAHDHQQRMVQRLPQPVVAPQVKPAPDGRYRRKAWWQHPPRQAATQQIQDRLDDPPHRPFAGSPDMRWRRQKRPQKCPFGIGQITWQSQTRAGMMRASGIGPHRRSLGSLLQNPQNQRSGAASSQPADTTQLNFGSGSQNPEIKHRSILRMIKFQFWLSYKDFDSRHAE